MGAFSSPWVLVDWVSFFIALYANFNAPFNTITTNKFPAEARV